MTRAYPLSWPDGEPRTPPAQQRTSSPFQVTPDKALRDLYRELERFKARDVILSSNVPVRSDGLIYADAARRRIEDPAVALYFDLDGQNVSICCDLYLRPDDNIRALFKIVEAMRTIERYGGKRLSQKSFVGFAALPPPPDCWKSLGISKGVGEALNERMRKEYVMDAFRAKVKATHGTGADMAALVEAKDQALQQLGVG